MDAKDSTKEHPPQDLVAIFHASFHPTKGNIIDWCIKADDAVDLTQVEFSCLPSGLHSINEDVVYFSKDDYQGVCVFRRRKTAEHGHRGFRLSSLGILLSKSTRSRPWNHVPALKSLVHQIYTSLEDREVLDPTESDWEPARTFFKERQVRHGDLGSTDSWQGWNAEMSSSGSGSSDTNPTVHLPHLLQILGPSCLTLYKHVLGRRRILVYTLPPVEAACILCQVAADLCYEEQVASPAGESLISSDADGEQQRLKGKSKEAVKVLGMITLSDINKLEEESKSGRGWIACTTDAIFLEKPSYYDLLIDLTSKSCRPALCTSKIADTGSSRRPLHKLSAVRFTWSDVKLWTELDRIIQEDADERGPPSLLPFSQSARQQQGSAAAWPDVWKVYEDVCVICAGLWMGPWRAGALGPDRMENWGSTRLTGEDDPSRAAGSSRSYVRNVGMGIEGRPSPPQGVSEMGELRGRARKRVSSGSSLLWSWASARASGSGTATPTGYKDVDGEDDLVLVQDASERRIATTLALLRAFHNNTTTLLSRFSDILPQRSAHSHNLVNTGEGAPIILTPKDLLSFDLGPLSGLDGRFVEWIAEEYGGGVRVVVRRGWRDIVALIFGLS